MSLLFRLVYATHANGTHHKLAMDALGHLTCENAEKWRRLFLKYSELYLEGAKAPDKEFKDFKNHVLHVRDNFWGGAPAKAANWYQHLVTAIREDSWEEAVYAAGVLSHYYVDPIEPLHTAQSEAENNIHRAVEWSISKSYPQLRQLGEREFADLTVKTGNGSDWVGDMVRHGAITSNAYYEKLITHYDVHKGIVHPPEGLDDLSRRFVAMLLRYAAVGFSAILDRAFSESGAVPPRVLLTPQIFLAGVKIPVHWITKKLEDAVERKLVEAMYEELQATGTVEENLDEDERTIRHLHRLEVLKRNSDAPARSPEKIRREPVKAKARKQDAVENSYMARELDHAKISRQADSVLQRIADEEHKAQDRSAASRMETFADTNLSEPVTTPQSVNEYYLKRDDKVVNAPSIGRKTAKKLSRAGIFRVSDLLGADPDDLAELLGQHYINPETIIDWQDQACLCCELPRLRGRHAQLLVGGGYRDADQIASADPRDIHPDIAAFCDTDKGGRINRGEEPPSLTEIGDWISRANEAKLGQAA